MKYKILKGTTLFTQLMVLAERCRQANQQASDLVVGLGFTDAHFCLCDHPQSIAGGLSGIEIKGGQPKGWRAVLSEHYRDMYLPYARGGDTLAHAKIKALPVVSVEPLNELLSFHPQTYQGRDGRSRWTTHPAVDWTFAEYILISMDENVQYTPVADMVEITASEFKALQEAPKK